MPTRTKATTPKPPTKNTALAAEVARTGLHLYAVAAGGAAPPSTGRHDRRAADVAARGARAPCRRLAC